MKIRRKYLLNCPLSSKILMKNKITAKILAFITVFSLIFSSAGLSGAEIAFAAPKTVRVKVVPSLFSGLAGSSNHYAVEINYQNTALPNATVALTAVGVRNGWTTSFSENNIAIADGEMKTVMINVASSAAEVAGIYEVHVVATVNETGKTDSDHLDFVIEKPGEITEQKQYGFGIDIPSGGHTFDNTPELVFDAVASQAGETASGLVSGGLFGYINSNYGDSNVAAKLFSGGFVGHLWSEFAGWMILDSDGVPGTANIGLDFGVVRNSGNLSGRAWSEGAGWIYMSCNDLSSVPGSCNPTALTCNKGNRATVDPNNFNVCVDDGGKLHGHAWSEVLGWINFENIEFRQNIFRLQLADNLANLNNSSNLTLDTRVVGYSYTTPELTEGKTYWWRVCDEANDDFCADYSTPMEITIDASPALDLIAPADDSACATPVPTSRPTFSWQVEDKASTVITSALIVEKYDTITSTWKGFLNTNVDSVIAGTGKVGISHKFDQAFADGKYRWKIKAHDNETHQTESDYWYFCLSGNGPQITCDTPAEGAITNDRTPLFGFNISNVSGENVRWKIIVDKNQSFSAPAIATSYTDFISVNGVYLTYQVADVDELGGGTYYWKIEAEDQSGNTANEVCSFITSDNVGPVITDAHLEGDGITVPDGGDTYDDTPAIIMNFTDESTTNNLSCGAEISQDISFATKTWEKTLYNVSAGCNFNVSEPLVRGRTYFWRARVIDVEGTTTTTELYSFNVLHLADGTFGNIGTEKILDLHMVGNKTDHKYAFVINNTAGGANTGVTPGWINFNPVGGGVYVYDDRLLGYAWSDTLGWIRMSCHASNLMGIMDGTSETDVSFCAGGGFSVRNDYRGNLSGRALLEQFGGYLYFDAATCEADSACPADAGDDIGVFINEEGQFSGYAWNPTIGWVDFNGANVDANDDSLNYFYPITEWTPDATPPTIVLAQGHYVFSATASKTYELATDNDPGDRGFSCPGGIYANNGATPLTLVDTAVVVDTTNQYTFLCSDQKEPDRFGRLSIVFDDIAALSELPGTYMLTGDIADAAGNGVNYGTATFQVVAGAPDFTQPDTYTLIAPANNYANGTDTYTVALNIRDQFGNPVVNENVSAGIYQGMTLKKVNHALTFFNTVDFDQYEPLLENDSGLAVNYTYYPLHNYVSNTDSIYRKDIATGMTAVDVSSFAPTDLFDDTNTQNHLAFDNVDVEVDNRMSGIYNDVGMCSDPANCVLTPNETIAFLPMLTADVIDTSGAVINFADIEFNENEETTFRSKINNVDPSGKIVNEANMLTKLTAYDPTVGNSDPSWKLPGIVFNTLRLVDEDGEDISTAYCDSDNEDLCALDNMFEESSVGYNRPFNQIMSEELFSYPHTTSWNSGTFNIATTPLRLGEVVAQDVGIRYEPYVSYMNGASEPVRHKVGDFGGSSSFIYKEISIGGMATGEPVDESAVSNPIDTRFIDTGELHTFSDMFEIVSRNIANKTRGKRDADKANFTDVNVASWDELLAHSKVQILKDKGNNNVIWFHGDGFNLNINGDIVIPTGQHTLIVEGGNIYLNGNIMNAGGDMDGSDLLGIVVLRSTGNNQGTALSLSGNFLIDPRVTNIKAAVVAERSVMSYDGTQVYDGFNTSTADLPNQIYWKGTIMSRNTVGGEQHLDANNEKAPLLPNYTSLWMPDGFTYDNFANESVEDRQKIASRFDLAHLRQYRGVSTAAAQDVPESYVNSSVIILYDEEIALNPPPLFELKRNLQFESVVK